MSDNRWQRVEDLFHRALDLAPEERSAFLDEACGADQSLRGEVESLLAHESEQGDTFAGRAGNDDDAPQTIAHYRISGRLGQGGMGTVYRATDTKLDREVAIKILPRSFAKDADGMARFTLEAKVLASLNHPNISQIYGIEESHGVHALVMELVEGESLASHVKSGALPLETALNYSEQIAEALEAAHDRGIVHRDLKPGNIMIRKDGTVKLLDFGLAKVVATKIDAAGSEIVTALSDPGVVMGTVGYMSPEQVRGLPVNYRTDLFSFGVVLYELVTGERPFTGNSPMAVCDAILHAQPRDFGASPAPRRLKAVIRKLLEKDPANRYANAGEVHQELKALEASLQPSGPVRRSKNAWIAVGTAAVLAGVLAGWLWHRSSRQQWARETAAPEIERLVEAGEYVKAAALTREARSALPTDPALEKLWVRATGEVSITSEPPGADVSIRPYSGDPNAWEPLGKTPLKKVRVSLTAYVWRLIKPGFAAAFFILEPNLFAGGNVDLNRVFKLRPEGSVPSEMVVVTGGNAYLTYPLGLGYNSKTADFLIDRHEVTNEEYKKFVQAGGYQKRGFWKQPFMRARRTVRWEDAMAVFHDATGRPGPATWEVGDYPKGREKHPVAGVSWYEAAAYAEFAGKSLPTAYHWMRASQATGRTTPLVTAGSNFGRDGTQPVGSEGALSGFGTTDMAGNVKEWCLSEGREDKRFILGGGFGEPSYMFLYTDTRSPWDRVANFGFRCVKLDSPPTAHNLERIEVNIRDYWKEKPVSDEVFKAYTALYAYDKGELNARVEETVTMENWSRTKVTFDAAYGHERVAAYLFLPKSAPPPYQVVVHFPAASPFMEKQYDLSMIEVRHDFLLKSGRAIIAPIFKGMAERMDGSMPATNRTVFRDNVIAWSKDLGRSLDYLETRKDIDGPKVAYYGDSEGAAEGPLMAVVEKRIKAAILSAGGFQNRYDLPEVDPFNFAKHVTIPVLMLGGRYDPAFPWESSQAPFFQFLGTPAKDKKQVIYEGGHGFFPRKDAVRECLDWLDKYLGPVQYRSLDRNYWQ